MKTTEYRREDRIYASIEDLNIIKDLMEDDRDGIDYSKDWGELMNVLEVLEATHGVKFEFGDHTIKLHEEFKTFSRTFMWHDYRTRKSVTYLLVVDVIKWLNSDYRKYLAIGVKEGIVTKTKGS